MCIHTSQKVGSQAPSYNHPVPSSAGSTASNAANHPYSLRRPTCCQADHPVILDRPRRRQGPLRTATDSTNRACSPRVSAHNVCNALTVSAHAPAIADVSAATGVAPTGCLRQQRPGGFLGPPAMVSPAPAPRRLRSVGRGRALRLGSAVPRQRQRHGQQRWQAILSAGRLRERRSRFAVDRPRTLWATAASGG